jgi:hypothetical protein
VATVTQNAKDYSGYIDTAVFAPKDERIMARTMRWMTLGLGCGVVLLSQAAPVSAQTPLFVRITPSSVTLLVGQSASFRVIDQAGHMVNHIAWHVSDPDAFWTRDGDEFTIVAREPGDYHVDGRSADGSAEATVTVVHGDRLPPGSTLWRSGDVQGCQSVKITPALPNTAGIAYYQQTQCDDGGYIQAYRANGVQMWRTKISDTGVPASAAGNLPSNPAARLNAHSASVCDSILVGDAQVKIRDLLHQQSLIFSEGAPAEHVWIIDETNTQCKVWFDDQAQVSKKRKVFVAE